MTKKEAIELANKCKFLSSDSRWNYIEKNGFVIWHDELIDELKNILNKYGLKTFVEVYAGTGHLTRLLNNIGVNGKGYTLDPGEFDLYGFNNKNEFTVQCIEDGILEYKDILCMNVNEFDKDLLVMSWIPLGGGDEILSRIYMHKTPEYILHIGEHYGCTGDDDINDYLNEKCEVVYEFEEHINFPGANDRMELLRRIRL